MALQKGDIEKVPADFTAADCYERIFDWHKKYGKTKIKEVYKRDDEYSENYQNLVDKIPEPGKANVHDMDYVFTEVIARYMEWAFHIEDEHGVKTAAYAHYAVNKNYEGGYGDPSFKESKDKSSLKDTFG